MTNTLFIVGAGGGTPGRLTSEARDVISRCRFFAGGPRLLEMAAGLAPEMSGSVRIGADLEAVSEFIAASISGGDVCVLTSGDPGCFSILPYLRRRFPDVIRVVPGISSVQMLASALALPWQDWRLVSLHGRGDSLPAQAPDGPTLYFCDENSAPPRIASRLLAGMSDCDAVAAENLGREGQRIMSGSLSDIAGRRLSGNSLLLVLPPVKAAAGSGDGPQPAAAAPGIPDDLWIREEGVPLSKSEVRAVLMAKAQPALRRVIWDVGAGTGSYGIESALLAPAAQVIAVEQNPAACHLVAANAARFGARVEVVCAQAPEGFETLAAPDLVIVGGNGGVLAPIIKAAVRALSPGGRLVVTAFLEQTKKIAHQEMAHSGLTGRSATRVSIARGESHEWVEQNPVILFTGDKEAGA